MNAPALAAQMRLPSQWRVPLAAWLALVAGLVLLYWNTLAAMVSIWDRSGTFAHCYLVAPISLWLVWRRREELGLLTPKPALWVLAPMAATAFAWLLGEMAGVNALTQFAFTFLLMLTVPLVMGCGIARRITFPLLYLLFMVPFGEFLLPLLMEWTADFTVAAVKLSGIPVYREGLQFVIPTGTWSVVEACSGVRYLIASLMVGSLFAYLNYTSTKRRLLFGLVCLAVPLLANWLRAYMIVMLGHLSGNRLAVGVDHLIYGWVFFGLVIGIMFFIGSRWTEPPTAPMPAPALGTAIASSGTTATAVAFVLASVVLLAPQALLWQLTPGAADAAAAAALKLADLPGTSPAEPDAAFIPKLQNPTTTVLKAYETGDGVVYVHVGYYRRQGFGRKLVTSSNALVNSEDKDWQLTQSGLTEVRNNRGPLIWRTADIMAGAVAAGAARRQRFDIRQIYWADGELTASGARATLFGVRGRLLGRGDDAAMVTVYTAGETAQQTQARLEAFLRSHTEALERQLVTYRSLR